MDVLAASSTGLITAAALALAVGLHVSTWGAYKDSPYEGYHLWRQVRTAVLAIGAGVVVVGSGFGRPTTLPPALGVAYTVERLATEWWKTILRNDDQTAYAIPMRLGFRGRPVDRHWLRYGAGIIVAAAIDLTSLAVSAAQSALGGLPRWLVVATVGGLGGWLTAVVAPGRTPLSRVSAPGSSSEARDGLGGATVLDNLKLGGAMPGPAGCRSFPSRPTRPSSSAIARRASSSTRTSGPSLLRSAGA